MVCEDVFRLSGTFLAVEDKHSVTESTGEAIERAQPTDKTGTARVQHSQSWELRERVILCGRGRERESERVRERGREREREREREIIRKYTWQYCELTNSHISAVHIHVGGFKVGDHSMSSS